MRFEVVHSNVVENGWFIKDNVGTLTFPTSTNLNDLFCYCRALNKLYEEKGDFNMGGKRFIVEVENGDVRILDMELGGLDIGQYDVCKLLNNLYEENKDLKIKIEELEDNVES